MTAHCSLLLALLLCGCSLMGLDEVSTVSCDSNEECAVLNEDREGECEQYVCHASGNGCVLGTDFDKDGFRAVACADTAKEREALDCDDQNDKRAPGVTEAHDGDDDDCDEVVDEGALAEPMALFDAPIADVEHVAYAQGEDGVLFTAWSSLKGHAVQRTEGTSAEGSSVNPCATGTSCKVPALSIAIAGDESVAGLVQTDGCAFGRLRLASLTLEPEAALVAPTEACSDASTGIDLDETDNRCTGANREDGARGVARLVSAAQMDDLGHANVLFGLLGDQFERDSCGGGDTIGVELLAVQKLDAGIAHGELVRIGETRGGGAPALASWESRGFLAAYGSADGGIAVAFAEPPARAESCEHGVELVPQALPVFPIEGANADQLALALAQQTSVCDEGKPGIELGLAWLEGCGTSGGKLWLARAGFAREPEPDLCVAGEAILLAEGDAARERLRPHIVHAPLASFVTADFTNGQRRAGEGRGGFAVAFVAAHGGVDVLLVQRLWQRDALVLAGKPIVLSKEGQRPRFPHLVVDGAQVSAYFYDEQDSKLYVSRLASPEAR